MRPRARRAPIRPQATGVFPAPELVPAITMRGITPLPLDPLLRPDAGIRRVLDLHHLGDEVGDRDQLGRRIAPGDHDVLEPRAVAQRRHHVVDVDPSPLDRVRDLVQQQELVALLRDHLLDAGPACARLVSGRLEILRDPRPAVAHLLPVDAAECRGSLGLADLPLARLHELEHAAAVPARPRAHQHAERRGALALAVAREHDQQRPIAPLAPQRLGAALVLRPVGNVDIVAPVASQLGGDWWIGHAAVLGILGALVSVCRRAPAACASAAASPRRTGPSSMSITCAASVARPRLAAARRTAPAGSWTRQAVGTTETVRRLLSRPDSRLTTCSARASPTASGVRPPVASRPIASAASSSGVPGGTSRWPSRSRNATTATRSRRA